MYWEGVKYLFLPDCFGRFSAHFYDQKKLIARRKKIWKNMIEVRTTLPSPYIVLGCIFQKLLLVITSKISQLESCTTN